MEFLGTLHPKVVHFPIALLLVSALFELVGRLTDVAWWRRSALALLVLGTLAAFVALRSGAEAEEGVENRVPHAPIEAHEAAANIAFYLSLAALAVRGAAAAAKGALASSLGVAALLLQLFGASAVGMAGYRGGLLVYEHGAGVKVGGQYAAPERPETEGEASNEDGERRQVRP